MDVKLTNLFSCFEILHVSEDLLWNYDFILTVDLKLNVISAMAQLLSDVHAALHNAFLQPVIGTISNPLHKSPEKNIILAYKNTCST